MWLDREDSLHGISTFTDLSNEVGFQGLTDEQLGKLERLPGNIHTIIASLDQLWKAALCELTKARLLREESDSLKAMTRFFNFSQKNPNFQNPTLKILQTPQWLWKFLPQVPQVFMRLQARPESGSSAKFSFAVSQRMTNDQILLTVQSYDCNESEDSLAALKLIEKAMQRVYPNLPEVLKIQFFD